MSEDLTPAPQPASHTRVVNVQGWAAFLFGLLALALGLAGGFVLRNALAPAAPASTPRTAEDIDSPEALMDFAIDQARHFQGDPDAPVTMIEFSDFQ